MSSVIFALDETQVILGTDTLCSVFSGPGSNFFGSKAFLLPHMNMLLASSGSTGFLEHWCHYLNTQKVFPGVEFLSFQAQDELRALWAEWKKDHPWPEGMEHEQAIFHFGISEFTGEMLGFAHISWDDFMAEELSHRVKGEPVIFAKPKCDMPDVEKMADFPAAFIPMMQQQRANQAANVYNTDLGGRVTIGGDLQIHHMNKAGCAVYKLARFDDYVPVETGCWGDFRSKYAAMRTEREATSVPTTEAAHG